MTEPRPINALLLAAFVLLVFALCAHGASSQVSNLDTRSALSQACWVEAGFSTSDCNAIVHVLKRRARRANGTVVAALNGAPSVCAGADHWGARNLRPDVRRAISAIEAGQWRAAECSARTLNNFYAEVRR